MHVGFVWVIVAKIGQFDARSAGWALGRRGCVFEVARGPRGSYMCVGHVGKSVLHFKLGMWSYTFYRFVVGLTIVGLIELLSCIEVFKNVVGIFEAVLVLCFSFEGKGNIVNVLLEIVEVNWHFIALILLEIVMVACCDVVGCWGAALKPLDSPFYRGYAAEFLVEFLEDF